MCYFYFFFINKYYNVITVSIKKVVFTVLEALKKGIKSGLKVTWVLIKIVVPVYIVISFLEATGVMQIISGWLAPLTGFIGLPGEASAIIASGCLLNIYTAIGTMSLFALTGKQVTLIAAFLLVCHSLITEGVIVKKMGANFLYITLFRFALAFVFAFVFNLVL